MSNPGIPHGVSGIHFASTTLGTSSSTVVLASGEDCRRWRATLTSFHEVMFLGSKRCSGNKLRWVSGRTCACLHRVFGPGTGSVFGHELEPVSVISPGVEACKHFNPRGRRDFSPTEGTLAILPSRFFDENQREFGLPLSYQLKGWCGRGGCQKLRWVLGLREKTPQPGGIARRALTIAVPPRIEWFPSHADDRNGRRSWRPAVKQASTCLTNNSSRP